MIVSNIKLFPSHFLFFMLLLCGFKDTLRGEASGDRVWLHTVTAPGSGLFMVSLRSQSDTEKFPLTKANTHTGQQREIHPFPNTCTNSPEGKVKVEQTYTFKWVKAVFFHSIVNSNVPDLPCLQNEVVLGKHLVCFGLSGLIS